MTTPDIERLRAALISELTQALKDYDEQLYSLIEQAAEALEATLQPAVGDGWKMVPVEPTEEMQIAGFEAWEATCFRSDVSQGDDIYKAMLAASPAIQEQKP